MQGLQPNNIRLSFFCQDLFPRFAAILFLTFIQTGLTAPAQQTALSNPTSQVAQGKGTRDPTAGKTNSNKRLTLDPAQNALYLGQNFEGIIPYQVGPIFSQDALTTSYGSEFNSYGNIFGFAVNLRSRTLAPTVAIFGQTIADGVGAKVWGGNLGCYINSDKSTCIGLEIGVGSLGLPNQFESAISYGAVIGSFGHHPVAAALQIQGTPSAPIRTAIQFNNTSAGLAGSTLLSSSGGATLAKGIDFDAARFDAFEYAGPSLKVGATPAAANSRIVIDGSSNGRPALRVEGVGAAPPTSVSLLIKAVGLGSVISESPLRAQGGIEISQPLIQSSAPRIATGFGISPRIKYTNGTAALNFSIGAKGASSGSLKFPHPASFGWTCALNDETSNMDILIGQTAHSVDSASFASYDRKTGLPASMRPGDVVSGVCLAY